MLIRGNICSFLNFSYEKFGKDLFVKLQLFISQYYINLVFDQVLFYL